MQYTGWYNGFCNPGKFPRKTKINYDKAGLTFMQFIPTQIPDVIMVEPRVFGDSRGYFMETYQAERFAAAHIPTNFVQDNQSGSQQGTLRGLHYQIQQPQGKLMRALVGEIFDVAVDIRSSSPTFGSWVGMVLSAENKRQLWIPAGFAHGFYVLSEWAEISYKTTDYYAPQWERGILWSDPDLNIDWPLVDNKTPILSTRDAGAGFFKQAEYFE